MAPFRSSAGPLIVSYVVMVVLSIVVVALRFMSIRILQRRVKVHDILCVISLVSCGQHMHKISTWRELMIKGLPHSIRYRHYDR